MNRFLFLKPGWWVLHVIVIAFVFWLGHAVHF